MTALNGCSCGDPDDWYDSGCRIHGAAMNVGCDESSSLTGEVRPESSAT